MSGKTVLDPCCAHRSFWFDSECPVAVFVKDERMAKEAAL